MQAIKQSDAFILMQFRDAVKHLAGLPIAQLHAGMEKHGKPFYERLKANGHDGFVAIGLMREVWRDIEREAK